MGAGANGMLHAEARFIDFCINLLINRMANARLVRPAYRLTAKGCTRQLWCIPYDFTDL